jgi:hypothetical protein
MEHISRRGRREVPSKARCLRGRRVLPQIERIDTELSFRAFGSRTISRREIPGFAAPSHDGCAFFGPHIRLFGPVLDYTCNDCYEARFIAGKMPYI